MMRFDRFTERAQEAAQRAAEIIQRYGHNQIDTEHILLALIEQPQGVIPQILEYLKVDSNALTERLDYVLRTSPKANIFGGGAGQIFITPRVKRINDLANEEANRLKDEYISTEHIFLAILNERSTPAARLLEGAGVTRERVYEAVQQIRGGQRVTDPQAETRYRTLEKYSRDLTQMAREGKLDPVIGRDTEILRVIQILSRRTKNNPVLIGEAGVGKTAIAEGLAQEIAGRRVVRLPAQALLEMRCGPDQVPLLERGDAQVEVRANVVGIDPEHLLQVGYGLVVPPLPQQGHGHVVVGHEAPRRDPHQLLHQRPVVAPDPRLGHRGETGQAQRAHGGEVDPAPQGRAILRPLQQFPEEEAQAHGGEIEIALGEDRLAEMES
jgi:hypothetical protein